MTPPVVSSSRARYQIDGAVSGRCGSEAISVDPVAERLIPAAQAFEAPANSGARTGESGSGAALVSAA